MSKQYYWEKNIVPFEASRKKVERAKKHIDDLLSLLKDFPSAPDFHSVSIDERNARYGINHLVIDIHKPVTAFLNEAALIIGDGLHNLRSALDILYCDVVRIGNTGEVTNWTRFPITDTREELISRPLKQAVEKKQISQPISDFISDTLKPYKTGNFALWAVHEMNIMDKHELLIPAFQMMGFTNIRLKNEKNEVIEFPTVYADKSCRVKIEDSYGWRFTLEDKGRAAIGIGFHLGVPYEGQPIIPALNAITEEVFRTVEAFGLIAGSV